MGGNEAAVRGLDLASEAGFEVKIVRLPGGTDPDEFLLQHGEAAFLKALQDAAGGEAPTSPLQAHGVAISLFDFRLEVASQNADPATLQGKKRIVAALLPFLKRVPNAIERFTYVKRLSERLGLRERDIVEELEKFSSVRPHPFGFGTKPLGPPAEPKPLASVKPLEGHTPTWRAERLLLTGVLQHKAAAMTALLDIPPEAFQGAETARLASHLRALFEEGRAFSIASLMDDFQDSPAMLELLAAAEAKEEGLSPDDAYRESAEQLKRWRSRTQLKAVQQKLERTTDPTTVTQLLEEKQRLVQTTS